MKKALKYFIFLALGLLASADLISQNLPKAPRDKSVKNGRLPNGMSYYLVTNPTTDNIADFALVQRTGSDDLGDQAVNVAREGLASLSRFSESPQEFLASHGVAPSRDGFVKVSPNATLYHFDNVILTESAIDSVLLMLVDLADRGTDEKDAVWSWYTPEDQAIVVSGDINAEELATKIKMLSYMTPYRPSRERMEATWMSHETARFIIKHETTAQVATVSAAWASPRIPKEYINTVQPAIYSMFINELGLIATERIRHQLQDENVPVADVSYEHVSSLRTFSDENFIISVTVAPEHVLNAVEALSSTMSALDEGSVTAYEFEMAKRRYLADLEMRANRVTRSNSAYIEYCASAFLYGAPLSSSREIYPFLKYRSIGVDTELKHFNKIASALLDAEKNLTVSCNIARSSRFTKDQLRQAFVTAWGSSDKSINSVQPLDSLLLSSLSEPIKLKSAKKEPMSGGVVWAFENGFRVVYKRQQTADNRVYYALALNGGYGNIRGLAHGEGAYVSDYLKLSNVSCVPAHDFSLALEEKGLNLTPTINLSNTLIEGSAPETELDMMMKAILAFVNERDYDKDAFDYYKSCLPVEQELMKGTVLDRKMVIDSLMCPGYAYTSTKKKVELKEDFPEKVEAFWHHQSKKTNDGALVLVGNVEETKLRKLLQNYVGEFKTTDRAYARLNVNYQPVSGQATYSLAGDMNSVDVAMSLRIALSAENYMATNIAAAVLKQLVSKSLEGTGMCLRIAHDARIYPQERFNMMISLEEADPNGFAHDVQLTGAADALTILRRVLADLPKLELTDGDLTKHKNVLKGQIALKMSDPQYWIHALSMRYLDGKDLTTFYESRIDEVTAEKVKNILTSLSETSRVEYIINK